MDQLLLANFKETLSGPLSMGLIHEKSYMHDNLAKSALQLIMGTKQADLELKKMASDKNYIPTYEACIDNNHPEYSTVVTKFSSSYEKNTILEAMQHYTLPISMTAIQFSAVCTTSPEPAWASQRQPGNVVRTIKKLVRLGLRNYQLGVEMDAMKSLLDSVNLESEQLAKMRALYEMNKFKQTHATKVAMEESVSMALHRTGHGGLGRKSTVLEKIMRDERACVGILNCTDMKQIIRLIIMLGFTGDDCGRDYTRVFCRPPVIAALKLLCGDITSVGLHPFPIQADIPINNYSPDASSATHYNVMKTTFIVSEILAKDKVYLDLVKNVISDKTPENVVRIGLMCTASAALFTTNNAGLGLCLESDMVTQYIADNNDGCFFTYNQRLAIHVPEKRSAIVEPAAYIEEGCSNSSNIVKKTTEELYDELVALFSTNPMGTAIDALDTLQDGLLEVATKANDHPTNLFNLFEAHTDTLGGGLEAHITDHTKLLVAQIKKSSAEVKAELTKNTMFTEILTRADKSAPHNDVKYHQVVSLLLVFLIHQKFDEREGTRLTNCHVGNAIGSPPMQTDKTYEFLPGTSLGRHAYTGLLPAVTVNRRS